MLSDHLNRLVILDGCNGIGIETALIVSRSALASSLQRIVLAPSSGEKAPAASVINHGISTVVKALQHLEFLGNTCLKGRLGIANPSAPAGLKEPNATFSVNSDLFLYVPGRQMVSEYHADVLAQLPVVEDIAAAPGTLIIVADNEMYPSITGAMKTVKHLAAYKVIMCRVPFHSPPDYLQDDPRFYEELYGPLENVCLGIALGVTRQLKVHASQPVGIVPLNVSINTALLSCALFMSKKLPPSLHTQNLFSIFIQAPTDTSLVWGMVGEYIIDYYGRYSKQINAAVPGNLFNLDPTLDFSMHFPDLWNYGMTLTSPVQFYRRYTSKSHRSHLKNFPHSTKTERMNFALRGIARALNSLPPPPLSRIENIVMNTANTVGARELAAFRQSQTPSADADDAVYLLMLRMISSDPVLYRLLPLVSMDWVQWEMYVKRTCVSVLKWASMRILQHQVERLPIPQPFYYNHLIFEGPDRAPETNLFLRKLFPDLHWTLRAGQQQNGSLLSVRAGGTEQRRLAILAQPHIQLLISQLARDQHVGKVAIEQRADTILRGIGDNLNHKTFRTLAYAIRKIFGTLYERINLNEDAYQKLFAAFKTPRRAVVIIPSHRSYVDFLVVSYLLAQLGLPVPHICSGEDFLKLGGVAEMMRGSGAFFMRRSFRGDKLYGSLFKEYVRHLVRDGECIEFFIEGMRSRTGKTLAPKIGILKFITDAFFEKQDEIDDVLILPIGLSYEHLLEGNIYSEELMGIPKPKETIGNLISSASILRSKYGALNVTVGDVISLKSFADDPHQCPKGFERAAETQRVKVRSSGSIASLGGFGSQTPLDTLEALAWRITYDVQANIVVTPTSLLAAALQCTVSVGELKAGVPSAHIVSTIERIRAAVLHRNAKMCPQFAKCDGSMLMSYAMQHLAPRLWISPLSHVFINTEMLATTQMLISIYTNQLVHIFSDEALIAVAVFAFGKQRTTQEIVVERGHGSNAVDAPTGDLLIPLGILSQKLHFLRKLLAIELPNYSAVCPISFGSWLQDALNTMYEDNKHLVRMPLTSAPDEDLLFQRSSHMTFVSHLIYPYIESLFVALISLAASVRLNHKKIEEAVLMRLAHEGALLLHKQQSVNFICSSSKENMKNSLQYLVDSKLCSVETSPTLSYSLVAGGVGQLENAINAVNDVRWQVANADGISTAIDALKGLLVSFSSGSKL